MKKSLIVVTLLVASALFSFVHKKRVDEINKTSYIKGCRDALVSIYGLGDVQNLKVLTEFCEEIYANKIR